MSLKQQIEKKDSPLGGFLREVFPSKRNRGLLAGIKGVLNGQETVCLLDSDPRQRPYSLVGHAVDYRIRYHFDHTAGDRLKWASKGAWAVTNIRNQDLFRILRTNASRLPGYILTPFGHVPEDTEDWQCFGDIEVEDGDFTVWRIPNSSPDLSVPPSLQLLRLADPDFERTALSLDCTLEIFDLLDRTIGKIAPHRRQPTPEEEREIARFCLALGVFESMERSGQGWPPSFLGAAIPRNATDFLESIPEPWVRDAAGLAGMFAVSRADWRGVPATLNPEFAGAPDVRGADGDLIVDGCLWDIKTTIRKNADRKWLDQLLGYILLDYEDEYAIESVGFLFPRQNASVHWPLADLMQELSGQADISLSDLRLQLRRRLRSDS